MKKAGKLEIILMILVMAVVAAITVPAVIKEIRRVDTYASNQ